MKHTHIQFTHIQFTHVHSRRARESLSCVKGMGEMLFHGRNLVS